MYWKHRALPTETKPSFVPLARRRAAAAWFHTVELGSALVAEESRAAAQLQAPISL
jgi:hypothetical protein